MESPANARHISQSKKKVFPGSTSSSSMEREVIEVAPPSADQLAMIAKRKAKGKRKQLAFHDIIDVDMDEDRNDVVFIERKVESNKKGKRSTGISLGSSGATKLVSKKLESNKKGKEVAVEPGHRFTPGSKNFIDLDDYVSDDDFLTLQAYFNSIDDLPTGIEAPIPWLPGSVGKKKKTQSASPLVTSHAQVEAGQKQQNGVDPLSTSTLLPSSKNDQDVLPRPRSTYFGSSSTMAKCDNDHVQKKYERFKKFDIVVDYSDHLYAKKGSAFKPQKNWAKKIQDEWKILEKDLNKPPKNFEDLVLGHFCNHVRDILMACKSYTEGVQVGCLVKGNVQDVEGKSSCSTMFRTNVASLIAAFNKIGAKGTNEFIPLTEK